jgi:hypothetical protein
MTEYSGIRGTRVKYLSSDPTLNTSTEGQVWYNSTEGTLKSLVQIKAWSSGGNLSTARRASGAMGTQTAGAIAGGQAAPAYVNITEEYSGFAWASGGNINTTRAFVNNGTVGTQTAGLIFGGEAPGGGDLGATEEYDGSTWTSNPTGLNTVRRDLGGVGIQTAALAFGGTSSPTAVTESYDGSSWTTSPGTLNTGRASLVGAGTQTAALAIGGPSTVVESWNGSSWTNGPSLNFQLDGSAAASGTQTNALTFGGRKPPGTTLVASSEQYDGNTWITTPSMATARRELMGMGTAQSGLATGGFTPPTFSAATEEYFSSIDNYDPSNVSAWASGGALGTARYFQGSATSSPSTAALIYGGSLTGTGNSADTEAYDGTSWSEQNNLNTARTRIAGFGTQTAAVSVAGRIMGGTDSVTNVEEYNGSWTNVTAYPFANRGAAGSGTLTAGLVSGGQIPPYSTTTNEYDGTNWTSGGGLNTARGYAAGIFGTQTATGFAGGVYPYKSNYEEYNGSSWSEISTLVTASGQGFGFGTIEGATIGNVPSAGSQQWNGSSWSTAPSMATIRDAYAGGGTSGSSGLGAGGYAGGLRNETEEFTGGSPASPTGAAASTLTTS